MALPTSNDILNGNCLLFLGARFSAAATNIRDESIKDVDKLITHLLSKCGISDVTDYDLETASQEFQETFNEEALVNELHDNFRSKSITEYQSIIICQPWYRIYTTNYDDIIENTCFREGKSITLKEVSDVVEPPLQNTTQLVHVYGNIQRLSSTEFRTNFLLTERQRDKGTFAGSP